MKIKKKETKSKLVPKKATMSNKIKKADKLRVKSNNLAKAESKLVKEWERDWRNAGTSTEKNK